MHQLRPGALGEICRRRESGTDLPRRPRDATGALIREGEPVPDGGSSGRRRFASSKAAMPAETGAGPTKAAGSCE